MSAMNQILVTGVPGPVLDAETAKMFRTVQPGGYILFARNIESASQLRKLIDDLRDLSEVEPVIVVDEEGGRVSRLRQIGHELPSAQEYRERGDRALIKRHGALTGQLMRLFGMNFNLCPVVEVSFDDEADNSLRGRCYGTTPQQVVEYAREFNQALRNEGILSCGKHFPGYAGVVVDPHHELPASHRTRAQLNEAELIPYFRMAAELDTIMTGHTWYSCFDEQELPSSLSSNIIKKLLREEIGFSGLVISDDLDMGALLEKYTQAESIRMAVEAGNDQLLICHRVASLANAAEALKNVATQDIDRALENIHVAKQKLKSPTDFSEARYAELNAAVWDLRVDTLGEEQAKVREVYKHKISPVETY